MGLKTYTPTSAGRRHVIAIDRSELWKGEPVKELTVGMKRSGGRNNMGHISTRHIGGGHKRRYRLVDFKRHGKVDVTAKVERLEYDPFRTAFIALIVYEDGTKAYILAPQQLKAGDTVVAGEKADIKPGNALPLKNMPVGTLVHNVELKAGAGGKLARSAGAYAQIVGRDGGFVQIRLMSGEVRRVPADGYASVGSVSNPDHMNTVIGKAGRARWQGKRPTVRGIAMNPVDHPNGGRTNGGKHWMTPWGKGTKGNKTRSNKRTDGMIIRRRAKKK